jgi:hypothetical protein
MSTEGFVARKREFGSLAADAAGVPATAFVAPFGRLLGGIVGVDTRAFTELGVFILAEPAV